jgi:hypothetical protein
MKIAFLILAHDKPLQLRLLVDSLPKESVCFIHVDSSVPLADFLEVLPSSPSVIYAVKRESICWAGYKMVSVTCRLMREALEFSQFDYLILLSGSDYPIKSNPAIEATLKSGDEYISYRPMPHTTHTLDRLDYLFFAAKKRNNLLYRIVNKLTPLLPRRRWPSSLREMTPCSGSSWFALTAECSKHILRFLDSHPEIEAFFRHTRSPDEMLFHTIVNGSPFCERVKPCMTYDDFVRNVPPYPAILKITDIEVLKGRFELFARKFDLSSEPQMFAMIERQLRS